MKCVCSQLPDSIYYEDAPDEFMSGLRKVDHASWVELHACQECKQHWAIDVFDKHQVQVIIRVLDLDKWKDQDTEPERKALLLRSRGGTNDQKCKWAGCENQCVIGVVYCLDHLYSSGARKIGSDISRAKKERFK